MFNAVVLVFLLVVFFLANKLNLEYKMKKKRMGTI
jgi:hypothetical protein